MGNGRHIKPPPLTTGARIGRPAETAAAPTNAQSPLFCLKYLQSGFTVHDCDKAEAAMFAKRLAYLCGMTWQQIHQADRHGAGTERIARDSLAVPIPSHVTKDVEAFPFFRLGGGTNATFGGLQDERIFHVFWIDPKGKAYAH